MTDNKAPTEAVAEQKEVVAILTHEQELLRRQAAKGKELAGQMAVQEAQKFIETQGEL